MNAGLPAVGALFVDCLALDVAHGVVLGFHFLFKILQEVLLCSLHLLDHVLVSVELGSLSPEKILLFKVLDVLLDFGIMHLFENSVLVLFLFILTA